LKLGLQTRDSSDHWQGEGKNNIKHLKIHHLKKRNKNPFPSHLQEKTAQEKREKHFISRKKCFILHKPIFILENQN
jgi:hypothetical protein